MLYTLQSSHRVFKLRYSCTLRPRQLVSGSVDQWVDRLQFQISAASRLAILFYDNFKFTTEMLYNGEVISESFILSKVIQLTKATYSVQLLFLVVKSHLFNFPQLVFVN